MITPEQIETLLAEAKKTNESIDRLNHAVLGDEAAGIDGMGKRLTDVEDLAESNEKRIDTAVAKTSVVGLILMGIWGVIINFKDKLFS